MKSRSEASDRQELAEREVAGIYSIRNVKDRTPGRYDYNGRQYWV